MHNTNLNLLFLLGSTLTLLFIFMFTSEFIQFPSPDWRKNRFLGISLKVEKGQDIFLAGAGPTDCGVLSQHHPGLLVHGPAVESDNHRGDGARHGLYQVPEATGYGLEYVAMDNLQLASDGEIDAAVGHSLG